jgi:hypothetical protein
MKPNLPEIPVTRSVLTDPAFIDSAIEELRPSYMSGSERLTGALRDRLTHHVHILEMNADSYRLKQSRGKRTPSSER